MINGSLSDLASIIIGVGDRLFELRISLTCSFDEESNVMTSETEVYGSMIVGVIKLEGYSPEEVVSIGNRII